MASTASVRFYPNELPEEGETVWVKVQEVGDMSVTVHLLEYSNHEAMIAFSELTRLRIRSVGKVIKVGRMEAVQVLRVDKEKRYVDLSKKQVTPKEANKCEERFIKARDVHSIVCHAADAVGMPQQQAIETVAYPLYLAHGTAWGSIKLALTKPDEVFGRMHVPENLKDAIIRIARHRLRDEPVKLRVNLEISCFAAAGVNAIREVLRVGQKSGEGQDPCIPLAVSIVAPPLYIVRAQTEHPEEGLKRLQEAVAAMQAAMAQYGGTVKAVEPPHILGDDNCDDGTDGNANETDRNPGQRFRKGFERRRAEEERD